MTPHFSVVALRHVLYLIVRVWPGFAFFPTSPDRQEILFIRATSTPKEIVHVLRLTSVLEPPCLLVTAIRRKFYAEITAHKIHIFILIALRDN